MCNPAWMHLSTQSQVRELLITEQDVKYQFLEQLEKLPERTSDVLESKHSNLEMKIDRISSKVRDMEKMVKKVEETNLQMEKNSEYLQQLDQRLTSSIRYYLANPA